MGLGRFARQQNEHMHICGTVVCSGGVPFFTLGQLPGEKRLIWRNSFMKNQAIVNRLSRVGIIGNILLSAFKLFAGIAGKSGAMVSDAVHSLSDVFATLTAFVGVKLSQRSADSQHPYGHERFECVASLVLGFILAMTGLGMGWAGVQKLIGGNYSQLVVPTALPLVAAVVSIAVKEGMYWYTMYYAKKLDSAAFVADAWHHRSDAFSSVGSFLGIGAAKLGLTIMDPIASVVICLFILKVAYDIIKDSLRKMIDTSCSSDVEKQMYDFISAQDGVEQVDLLHTRLFGNKVYVDVEISVERDSSLLAAHNTAERVHDAVERQFPNVKHVMIHVNPGAESTTTTGSTS